MDSGGYRIVDQYATYFLTFTIVGWVDLFSRRECKHILIDDLQYCQENKGFILYAYVIMESHIHLIASAKENTNGLSSIIRDFKRSTSKKILRWIHKNKKESRRDWLEVVFRYYGKFNTKNDIFQVWKQDNHPEQCIHPSFTMQKLNYIHNNPVVAGIVDKPIDYRFSSARNYAGRSDTVLEVVVLDFGSQVGYVM